MNVTRSPTGTINCRGSTPDAEMRMIGGSAVGGVGPVGGAVGGVPDEPPQVDASAASALVTKQEKIFRGQ